MPLLESGRAAHEAEGTRNPASAGRSRPRPTSVRATGETIPTGRRVLESRSLGVSNRSRLAASGHGFERRNRCRTTDEPNATGTSPWDVKPPDDVQRDRRAPIEPTDEHVGHQSIPSAGRRVKRQIRTAYDGSQPVDRCGQKPRSS